MDVLEGLNPDQRKVVKTTEGRILVVSGAGTGKSTVLTRRAAHILERGLAKPDEIMVLAFNREAAASIKQRIRSFAGCDLPWARTYHGAGLVMLKDPKTAAAIGLDAAKMRPLSASEQTRLMIKVMTEQGRTYDLDKICQAIEKWKEGGLLPDDVRKAHGESPLLTAYARYQELLAEGSLIDHADMLNLPTLAMRRKKAIARAWGERFRYVMVDEYQDTNRAQYQFVRQLAAVHGNLCCVGDDAQAVYGWRGADIRNMLDFQRDNPEAITLLLEQNYRSTKQILAVANTIIAGNPRQLKKELWTTKTGSKPKVLSFDHELAEAYWVTQDIARRINGGQAPKEIAILVRVNRLGLEFARLLKQFGIQASVVGGSVFATPEVATLLAYLRVLEQSDDDEAFMAILDKPNRYLGTATATRIEQVAATNRCSAVEAAMRVARDTATRHGAKEAINQLIKTLDRAREIAGANRPNVTLRWLMKETGYSAWVNRKASDADSPAQENLDELLQFAGDYSSIPEMLRAIDELDAASRTSTKGDKVTISTIHRAKGDEWDTVYLPCWEEGQLPHAMSIKEGQDRIDEERRLAYVAVTRPRDDLIISYAVRRRGNDTTRSRFLVPLGADLVERESHVGNSQDYAMVVRRFRERHAAPAAKPASKPSPVQKPKPLAATKPRSTKTGRTRRPASRKRLKAA